MTLNTDYLIGRRFTFVNRSVVPGGKWERPPDVTFTGAKPGQIRAHMVDGGREWIPVDLVVEAITQGVLVESERGVPFVLEREPARRVGVMGKGKTMLRLVAGGKWERF